MDIYYIHIVKPVTFGTVTCIGAGDGEIDMPYLGHSDRECNSILPLQTLNI